MIANPKGCVGLEDIAALAEGRLSGAERERVVGHIAECEECREVLAGVLEVAPEAPEEGTRDDRAETAPHLFPSRPSKLLVAAAAVILVLSGVLLQRQLASPEPPSRAAWLAAMPPPERLVPELWGGVVMRGGSAAGDEIRAQSVELGALLVDLDVATAAGDAARAADVQRRMASILESAGLVENQVRELRARSEADSRIISTDRGWRGELDRRLQARFLPFYLDLGAFAEQARLAGRVGAEQYLRGRSTRRYQAWLLDQEEEPLDPAVTSALEVIGKENASPVDQGRAGEAILRALTLP